MMRLYFVRHGESEANVRRVISNRGRVHPLTARGRAQAAALAERLCGVGLTRIYTSPLLRAVETAEIVSAALGVPYEETAALRECDFGTIEGRADEEAWAQFWRVIDAWDAGDWTACMPDGESALAVQARFIPFLDGLLKAHRHTEAAFLLVAHGGLFGRMLPLVLTNADSAFATARPIEHASAIVAEWRGEGLVCVEWGGETIPILPS